MEPPQPANASTATVSNEDASLKCLSCVSRDMSILHFLRASATYTERVHEWAIVIASHPNGTHAVALLRKHPIPHTSRGREPLGEVRRFLNREIGNESVRGALAHGAIAGNLNAAAGMPFLSLHQPSLRLTPCGGLSCGGGRLFSRKYLLPKLPGCV